MAKKSTSKYELVIDKNDNSSDFNSYLCWNSQHEYYVQKDNLKYPIEIKFDWSLHEQYNFLTEEIFSKVILNFKKQTGCEKVSFGIDKDYGYYDSIEAYFVLSGQRLETDEEFQFRLEGILAQEEKIKEINKKAKIQKEAHELAEYERLKKKFEKT